MRNLLFVVVALLIAAPAMALVTITSTEEPGGWVRIDYTVTGEAEKMRAVALDILTDTGTISDVSGYKTGESIATSKGYGIFPGSIDLTDTGNPVWNDPVAPDTDPGAAGTGLGTNRVIIELGSLYDKTVPTDAPDDAGTLCRVRVTTANSTVTVAEELTYRGGIVMEDSNPPTGGTAVSGCVVAGLYTGPDQTTWTTLNKPASWASINQCHGDADSLKEPAGRGTVYVGMNDVYKLIDGFRKPGFDGVNLPDNPGDGPWICADFDHLPEAAGRGTVRVGMVDVYELIDRFRDPDLSMPGDCQTP